MDLKGILTIATYPGLYRHVAQAVKGIIIHDVYWTVFVCQVLVLVIYMFYLHSHSELRN